MNHYSANSSSRSSQHMDKEFIYSDEELIARFQNGDEQAYVELVNRYRDRLMTFVYRFVNDGVIAEDIVQDTLVKLYTHKDYYRNIAKFSTWIYTIAGNLAKTELRKKKRRKVTIDLFINEVHEKTTRSENFRSVYGKANETGRIREKSTLS